MIMVNDIISRNRFVINFHLNMPPKKRLYHDNYLEVGFTSVSIDSIARPKCVVCKQALPLKIT